MRDYAIIFIVLICYSFSMAQSHTLSGIVSDSLQKPLSYVTILAEPSGETESLQFVSTDSEGKYSLELRNGDTYSISVNMLGFQTLEFDHNATENQSRNLILVEDVTQLDPVTVVMELPISIKEDTITYRVDKFITGEERKLKDIMEKLPGIEVDEYGTVTSQGKIVTHVLVENKSFFGGNSKLAVDNIPANSVDQIEIIDDYNEIAFLKGMTDSDNMALNIKLKENKKNFVFGDIEAGKGNDDFYNTHANLFYYRPELNINFIGGLNNTAERLFTYKDYQNFTGGPSTIFNPRDRAERTTLSNELENTDVIESENEMGALNITDALGDKMELSGFLIYSGSNNRSLMTMSNQYLLTDTNISENISTLMSGQKNSGIGKIRFKLKPDNLEELSFDFFIKATNRASNTAILSVVDEEEQALLDQTNLEGANMNGNLEWHKKLSKKHALSANAYMEYNKSNSNALWETDRAIYDSFVPLEEQDIYFIKLLRLTENKDYNVILKHYWNIDNFNLVHTTIGNQYRNHNYFTNDDQILDSGNINDLGSSDFRNNLGLNLNDFYLGAYYNAQIGKFELHQSLFLHNYSWSVDQSNVFRKNKWVLLPEFSIRTGSKSANGFLRLDSNLKNSFSDISRLAEGYYLQSYNSINIGDANLENELSHYSSLTYSKTSLFRGLYLLGVFGYEYRINGIVNSIVTENQDRIVSPIRLDRPNQKIDGTFIFNKTKNKIKYALRGKLVSMKSSELVNSTILEYRRNDGSYRISAQTLHKKFPVIEVGFKQSIGNYRSSNNSGSFNFITNEPFMSFDYDFLKNFVGSFDYKYYEYQNRTVNLRNTFSIANASLAYGKEASPWEFKVSVENLFDVRFKNQNSFNVFVVSDSNTFILPRITMFSVIYRL